MSEYIDMFRVVKAMALFIRVQSSVFLFLNNFRRRKRGEPATMQEYLILMKVSSRFRALIPGDLPKE